MKTLLTFLSLVLFSSLRAAEYDAKVEQAVKLVEIGQRAEAMDSFFEGNRYVSALDATYQSQRTRFADTARNLGDLQYVKKVGEYKFADSVVIVKYLVVYEAQPLFLNFKLFRKKNGWSGASMAFSDFDEVLNDLASRELIRENSTATAGRGTPKAVGARN